MTDTLYVLDTSAILTRKLNLSQENFIIPYSVIEEIRLGKIARALEWSEENLRIAYPGSEFLKKVLETAEKSSDLAALSKTDLEVIAIALEHNATIVTDDFAIENVASLLGVKFLGADLKPIQRIIEWRYRCTGCGKKYSVHLSACPVCGHELRRTVKSYKKSQDKTE